ncbi:DoxX family protein [Candidatus Kaiserbacteria bacterium]|nr:DoxX family protein [Candidatus Kaiserbacteria bacterium]
MDTSGEKPFALLRILFGAVWLVDAVFKWNPAFFDAFTSYVVGGTQNQPPLVQSWIDLWVNGANVDPYSFAVVVAIGETAIALSLLFGVLTQLGIAGGIAMMLVVWSTAEGFGGPYVAGSTDIGAAAIYVIVFVALWFGRCWRQYSLDPLIRKWLPVLYQHW